MWVDYFVKLKSKPCVKSCRVDENSKRPLKNQGSFEMWLWATKKIFLPFLRMNSNSRVFKLTLCVDRLFKTTIPLKTKLGFLCIHYCLFVLQFIQDRRIIALLKLFDFTPIMFHNVVANFNFVAGGKFFAINNLFKRLEENNLIFFKWFFISSVF